MICKKRVTTKCVAFLMACTSVFSSILISNAESPVAAHSGGTDKYGCHGGSQPYHCHSSLSATEMRDMLKSIERQYMLNGLTANAKFVYKNKRYKSCSELNSQLLRGVSISKIARESLYPGLGGLYALVSLGLYKKNRHLDADKDGVACGLLEPENARVQTIPCSTGGQDAPDGLTISTGFKCAIDSKILGGWLIEILSYTPNATDAVLAEDEMNDLPNPGNQFFIATIKVTNLTGKRGNFIASDIKAQGAIGNVYDHSNTCGPLLPNRFWGLDIPNGGNEVGNLCWEIDSRDADSLVVLYSRYSNEKVYVRLK
jgi:hypothetical protein